MCALWLGSCCSPSRPAPPPAHCRRVVLVHGFLETGASFKPLQARLEARGFHCLRVKLRPSDGRGGLERLAEGLKRDIDATYGLHLPISLVSFSMGGLVSRYYLQELGGASRCDQFITISSPHHGTWAAYAYPSESAERKGAPAVTGNPPKGQGFIQKGDHNEPYSGCYANVLFDLYTPRNFRKVSCGLKVVQFVANGPRIGASTDVTVMPELEETEELEGAEFE